VLRLSLPAAAGKINVRFRETNVLRVVEVIPGTSRVLRIPICGTGPVELHFTAMTSGRLADGRMVSVASQPPIFKSDAEACAAG
jgi:hypothetical protein